MGEGMKRKSWSDGKKVSDYYGLARKYFPSVRETTLFYILFDECDFYNCASELQLEQKLINHKDSLKV